MFIFNSFWLALLFVLFFSCSDKPNQMGVVSKITLYNTISDELKDSDVTFQVLQKYHGQEFTSDEILSLINQRVYSTEDYLWKGNIFGKINFSKSDSSIIKISRYGAFFKDIKSHQKFIFKTDESKRIWQKLINDFISEN